MIDLATKDARLYDSVRSSYLASIRVVAAKLVLSIPDSRHERFRTPTVEGELGIQFDSYNGAAVFGSGHDLDALNKKMPKYLRYRYLCMRI
ncbi:hypothetical protein PI125_g1024 [Phytophthora idaei]|nr:hypothetical protein PI125_g1024 [Phytophthora idaei]KAG3133857.1 hypothetical protein PI126_g18968 [Phytophthora idaei]